jgi:hypothetical protein
MGRSRRRGRRPGDFSVETEHWFEMAWVNGTYQAARRTVSGRIRARRAAVVVGATALADKWLAALNRHERGYRLTDV